MKENEPDQVMPELERRARADLRRLVAATDPAILVQLQKAAASAARLKPSSRSRVLWLGLPIGAAAAASVVALMMWRPAQIPLEQRSPAADDLALLMNVENLDLLEQMEFYQWLDREPALLESDPQPGAQRS
ncbi:MAG: hypothetical protein K0Q92_1290 [Steroidobacteraceae bacterium]|jgi:hypothetical protein|nr:hypothetical protein [Steroidobacteraceae bacterium]